jgi:serine/threonine protein kinase
VTNKFIGTKGYAAPELIIGIEKERMIEGKALDIWSLGISLLELLERKHPFSVKTI